MIKNAKFKSDRARDQRATKSFSVSGSLEANGPWELLLEEEFDNPLTKGAPPPRVQTFYFKEAATVKFLRFDLKSYWGDYGGGLDYFVINTKPGNLCCNNFGRLSNIFMIDFPISPFLIKPFVLQHPTQKMALELHQFLGLWSEY